MPKGYLIGHVTVNDAEAYQAYIDGNAAYFAKYGAKILVRGGDAISAEGGSFERHVLFEFPDFAAAKAMYNDPGYQEHMKIRTANATSMIVLAEGVSDG